MFEKEIGTSFTLGGYTIRVCMRPDNPAFPIFVIYRGETLIGKHLSRPGLSDCERLERPQAPCVPRNSRWLSENRRIWNALKRSRR